MADTVEIDNEDDFEEMDIVIEEDGTATEAPSDEDSPQPAAKNDAEAEEYSNRVQSRINKLTAARREAERQRDEAITFAKKALKTSQERESQSVDTMLSNLQLQEQDAKDKMRAAKAVGDTDKETEAQAELVQIIHKKSHVENYKASRAAQPQAEEQPQAATQPAPATPKPDPRAEQWAEENPWFGVDREKTIVALKKHKELIEDGVDPKSEEYYNALDSAFKKPQKDDPGKPTDTVQAVNSSTRTSPAGKRTKGRRTVRLTKSQLAIAEALGVTPAQYAAQLKE